MEIHLVLDNIRSVFNVGSIFRSADGAGSVKKIYLCRMTSDINNPKLEKLHLEQLKWFHLNITSTQDALEEIRANNIPIYSVELTEDAVNFQTVKYPLKIALIFGQENGC